MIEEERDLFLRIIIRSSRKDKEEREKKERVRDEFLKHRVISRSNYNPSHNQMSMCVLIDLNLSLPFHSFHFNVTFFLILLVSFFDYLSFLS